ncbi:hypothetical protein ERJ75_001039800 [Trypanosoma vivax]|uniref:BAP29/BAP31 transmembrane domain-containing protein n=1 Tax=Trypanosoma vivax (strain Y486) TaxID=1055687 RepID=G0TUY7_TRYVY|nr:hypothetical protein TRVL_01267 [Trypanosoma vivax]KAH8610742.1 hypothetical protein ERJ75_001039800 [Trypanosoma vivax]CCC47774.1 conserved hypothetical protein [Trypanosoma vivax Y486]
MVSALTFEVNFLIIPAFVIFVLFVIPIPILSRTMCRLVGFVERIHFGGVSILLATTVLLFIGSALQFLEWRNKYGAGKPRFSDLSLEVDWEGRKWRHERNMYIHILAVVLCAAVMKFARLHDRLQRKEK